MKKFTLSLFFSLLGLSSIYKLNAQANNDIQYDEALQIAVANNISLFFGNQNQNYETFMR